MTLALLTNQNASRVIPSRYPPVGIFDYVSDQEAAEAAIILEQLTGARTAPDDMLGRLAHIPIADRIYGVPGAHQAMAAFLYGAAGRFNDDQIGAWYAALDLETAIAETVHHNTKRLAASASGFPNRIHMRELINTPRVRLESLRRIPLVDPRMSPDDYSASQAFAAECRTQGRDGIWFRSVRRPKGNCIVLFRPRQIVPIRQGQHFEYRWDRAGACTVATFP